MKKLTSLILALFLLTPAIQAQLPEQIQVIDPPFWWAEMPVNELQLQLYGDELGLYRASTDYSGVTITKQLAVDSPNYLFLYFDISDEAEAGMMEVILTHHNKEISFKYELKTRESTEGRNQGFNPSDVIYLMMP